MNSAQLVIHLLGGVIFSLSGFVIFKHYRRWKRQERSLLPFHIWSIAISYNLLILSLMWRGPENDTAFIFGSSGLILGIFSLGTLVRYQIKSSKFPSNS